ncbi:MAG TPA: NifU family protein [Bacillota bacterium]|nr:NifU family protein [Bacillota bacterium]HRC54044.1 NifU family protein [Bacillota bacterium]
MKERVEKILEQIRPSLQFDGGDVELVEVTEDGIVKVKLTGACGSCPFATMTLKAGIERILKQEIPEIKEVQEVSSRDFMQESI